MSGGKASGLATVVDELLARHDAAGDEGDGQLSLLDPAEFEPQDVGMPVPPVQRSGPQGGRPKGARNKSTEELRRYLDSRYRHPLIVLAEMYSRPAEQLAKDLKLYKHEYYKGEMVATHLDTGAAAALQRDALVASLPYRSQKMPIAIEQKGDKRGVLVLGNFVGQQTVNVNGLPLADGEEEPVVIDQSPLGGDPA